MSLGLIDVGSGVFTTSSHATTGSSTRLFVHMQSFRYSLVPQFLTQSQVHMLGFRAWSSSRTRCFVGFLHSRWHLSLFHFCFELHFLWSRSNLHSHKLLFYQCFWFICSFCHIKYFQIYIFYFIGHTNSIKWIFNSITTSNTPT